jgi:hypothetical protein
LSNRAALAFLTKALIGIYVDAAISSEVVRNLETQQTRPRTMQQKPGYSSSEASLLSERLKSFNFTCEATNREAAFVCRGRIEGYPEPVRVFIPRGFRAMSKRLAIHFHGNNSASDPRDNTVHFKDGRGDFLGWLDEADSEHILVVPDSLGSTRTYDTQFPSAAPNAGAANFDRLIQSIEELAGMEAQSIALSAHSGGYRALGALGIADSKRLNQVDAVGLFDAVYGRAPQLITWIPKLKNRGGLFYVVYVENGTTLTSGLGDQRELNSLLQRLGVVPKEYKPGRSHTNISVNYTKSAHMDVLKDQKYADFLRSIKSLHKNR